MATLSVIILTHNEAHNIVRCLSSVAFADEILVWDSGSTDGTPELCRAHQAKVTITPDWPGYGPQKVRALAAAKGDWVLCLDADESLTPPLAEAIQAILKTPSSFHAYRIPYRSFYCGKQIRFGDWFRESHVRLFQRQYGQFSNAIVHCQIQVAGPIGRLRDPILHYPYPHLEQVLRKMNTYSTLGAQLLFERKRKASLGTALSHAFWAFFRGYCLRLGFLDGKEGFLLAISNAQGTYYRYLKLSYLWQTHASSRPL